MGNYVLCKSPVVKLDLMVAEKYSAQLVSYIQRMGCTYASDDKTEPVKGRAYRVFHDIQQKNGHNLAELIGLFYSLEWGSLREGDEDSKFYMMLTPHRKGKGKKKHVCEDRKETDSGSDSGDRGEPAGNPEPGDVDGCSGDGIDFGDPRFDDPWEFPGEATTCDGRCE